MSVGAAWRDWSCSVSVRIEAGQVVRAETIVRAVMADVDRAVSRFRDDSEVSAIARLGGQMVPVSRLTVDLVERALSAAQETNGAVDPTVGAQVAALGYDRDIERVMMARCGSSAGLGSVSSWRGVRVDRRLGRVGVPAGVELDLGAVAKAWTADEAARRVHATLGVATLVEIGGDLAAIGRPTEPWQIDVAEIRGGPAARVSLAFGGLATSSIMARRWPTADGRIVHHLVDPRTGRSVEGTWRTVSVWAPTAAAANTVSTAVLVRGECARHLLGQSGTAARLVTVAGEVEHVGPWPVDHSMAS